MFKRFFENLIAARQERANIEIARILQKTEYKNETPEYLADWINETYYK